MSSNFSMEEVELYVNHLLEWNLGHLINKITLFSTFQLVPKQNHDIIRKIQEEFEKKASSSEYSSIIQNFQKPTSYTDFKNQLEKDNKATFGLFIALIINSIIAEINIFVYPKN
jgi:hypothetical protein